MLGMLKDNAEGGKERGFFSRASIEKSEISN
jgi:hypothetical protein